MVNFDTCEEVVQGIPLETRLFSDLVDIVTHQQLAGKAAVAILTRMKSLLGNPFDPSNILSADLELLRSCGLSGAKMTSITGLPKTVNDGQISLSSLAAMPDNQVISKVCSLKGFGPWSAEMFLMTSLGRMHMCGHVVIWEFVRDISTVMDTRFSPNRSLAAWYMWKSLLEPVSKIVS